MKYNFDEVIERRGTDSVKWDGVENVWGRKDLLPMWVADMDFRTPPFVMDALRRRLDHEVLGYTFACEEWYTSICSWLHKRHQWDVTRDMLTFVPGIVRGQAFALQCFTKPGDKVMVMTPVYHPFFLVTERLDAKWSILRSICTTGIIILILSVSLRISGDAGCLSFVIPIIRADVYGWSKSCVG